MCHHLFACFCFFFSPLFRRQTSKLDLKSSRLIWNTVFTMELLDLLSTFPGIPFQKSPPSRLARSAIAQGQDAATPSRRSRWRRAPRCPASAGAPPPLALSRERRDVPCPPRSCRANPRRGEGPRRIRRGARGSAPSGALTRNRDRPAIQPLASMAHGGNPARFHLSVTQPSPSQRCWALSRTGGSRRRLDSKPQPGKEFFLCITTGGTLTVLKPFETRTSTTLMSHLGHHLGNDGSLYRELLLKALK